MANPYNAQDIIGNDIGDPIPTFSNKLKKNEIWLEGALAKILSYPLLFEIYGYDYTPEGMEEPPEGYFYLPDIRDRAFWGSPDGTFGYLDATAPNITGSLGHTVAMSGSGTSTNGALTITPSSNNCGGGSNNMRQGTMFFNAHNSNPIYQDGATVRTPSIKCRVKTRYK